MVQQLRKPPRDFEAALRLHFSLRKIDLLALCEVFLSLSLSLSLFPPSPLSRTLKISRSAFCVCMRVVFVCVISIFTKLV